jgi:Tol biopolymer transport system component
MGEVYKARDTRLQRLAALKLLPPDKMADAERRARFIQEAQAASALNHPHIVTIYGIDREVEIDYIAMEYVQGRTLEQAIGRRGMKLSETLRIGIQIAEALAAAHAVGIVHRDLKPSNVMINQSGSVKVLDFGLAKLGEPAGGPEEATRTIREDAPLTEKGTILGTVSYMSPEQAEGKVVGARSDIFSFGSVLYEMVTGRRAFHGTTKMSTLSAILRDQPKPASEVAGEAVPRDLEKIIARCLRKEVTRRFQHMDDVKIALEELKEESESGQLAADELVARKERRSVWLAAGIGIAMALALAAVFVMRPRPGSNVGMGLKLRQLTQDAGLTSYPAISPDGKLIAYASDRAGDAGLDIWVQQLSRGAQPIRLTKDPADEKSPSFSPDGVQIVFESQREGGGIYVIPSLGGEERLLMRGHLQNPRFSPDGQWVATSSYGTETSKLFVVPGEGGAPRSVGDTFYDVHFSAWSPDRKKVLASASTRAGGDLDWWIIPLDGGPAIQTGALAVLQKFQRPIPVHGSLYGFSALEWLGDYVLYSDGNLWRTRLSRDTGKVTGDPERLTTATDVEGWARAIPAASGQADKWRIVFGSTRGSEHLWSLPIDLNAAKPTGEPRKLIHDVVNRNQPSVSADGRRLAYVSQGLESYSLRTRDVATGAEQVLLQRPAEMHGRISPDGSTVAYNPRNLVRETDIYLAPTSGGESRKLCDTCGLIYNWTPDGKRVLFRSGSPSRFSAIDAATGQQRVILAHPKYHIHAVEFSPDGRWLAFHYGPDPKTPRAIYLVPVRDGQAADESEWIAVMNQPGAQLRPWWSPDGNVIYLLSTAGGKMEVWAQRLEAPTKRPVGEPFRIYSPPTGERFGIGSGNHFGPGIGPRELVFAVNESSGNIWIASRFD